MPDCSLVSSGSVEQKIYRNKIRVLWICCMNLPLHQWLKAEGDKISVLLDFCKYSQNVCPRLLDLLFKPSIWVCPLLLLAWSLIFFFSNYWLVLKNLVENKTNLSMPHCSGKMVFSFAPKNAMLCNHFSTWLCTPVLSGVQICVGFNKTQKYLQNYWSAETSWQMKL